MKGRQIQKEMDYHKTVFGTFDFQHLIAVAIYVIQIIGPALTYEHVYGMLTVHDHHV